MNKKIIVLSVILSITVIGSIIPGLTIIPKVAGAGPDFQLLIGGGSQGHQPSPADIGQSTAATVQLSGSTAPSPSATLSITDISPSTGLTCGSINPTTLPSGQVASLSCTGDTRGTYTVTVSATNSSVTRTATWTFWIQEFFLAPTSPAPVDAGIDAKGTVTLTRLGSHPFNDTVTLTDSLPGGLVCGALTPASLGPGPASGQKSDVLCHASTAGNYPLTVTGSFTNATDTYTNSTIILFRVRQFSVSATAPTPIIRGGSATSTIAVNSLNGFNGAITLTSTTNDPNLSCGAITPNTMSGNWTATISCSATIVGGHALTITATGGVQSYTAGITITVIGQVCMLAPQDLASPPGACPSTPSIYNGPVTSPNTLLKVPILADNLEGFQGFDITVNSTNTAVLKPYGIDLANSVVPSPIILVECVSGNLVSTAGSCVSTDTPSTVHLSVTSTGGNLATPATGLLFTAIFNITGTTPSGGIAITFQTGCTASSVSGTTNNECVFISNGTSGGVLVNTQTATFDNSDPTPVGYVTVTQSASSQGPFLPGSNNIGTTTLTYTANNGFDVFPNDGLVSLKSSIAGTGTKPIVTLSTTSLDLTTGAQAVTITGSVPTFVQAGNYTVTISASYTATNEVDFTTQYSLAIDVQLTIRVVDYSISTSPNTVTAPVGISTPVTTTLSVTSLNGFSGTVKLAKPVIPGGATGVTATYNTFVLTGSQTATLTITTAVNTPVGTYTINLNSNTTIGGTLRIKSTTVILKVQGFTVSASPTSVSVAPSTAGTSTITITGLQGFTATVSLSTSILPASGLTCTLTPTNVSLNSTKTTDTSILSCSGSAGMYTVTVTGSATGFLDQTAIVTYLVVPPDFSIAANPTSVNGQVNLSANSTITVTSIANYNGPVSFSSNDTTHCTFTPGSVNLGTSATSKLSCTFTSAGTFGVIVTGTGTGAGPHTTTVNYTITAGDFTLTANPTSVPAYAHADATSTITVSPLSGFTGTVTLTSSNNPAAGLSCTFSSSTVIGGSGTSTLICNADVDFAITYTVTVNGTSAAGLLLHRQNVTFVITLQHLVSLSSTFTAGQSSNVGTTVPVKVTIHNTGLLDETVTVFLRADNSTVVTLDNISVSAGTTKEVTLSWDTTGYSAQQYTLSVFVALANGETNSASSTTSLGAYTLNAPPQGVLSGLDNTLLIGLIVVIIVAAGSAILVLRRRRPKPQTTN